MKRLTIRPHITICVAATQPMPTTLPHMRVVGLTDDTTTSSTRLFFSSMMDVITICPYRMMNM